jgi:hypothetical protein
MGDPRGAGRQRLWNLTAVFALAMAAAAIADAAQRFGQEDDITVLSLALAAA